VDDGLPAGSTLAGFTVERLIAAGGMGAVYLARDPTLKRPVALKIIAPALADDARYRERFLFEAELSARLEHPAIVPVYGAGEDAGRLYLAMRYVEGETLADRLASGPIEAPAAVSLLAPIADALDTAHAAGLVHRDVKPGNVLLERDRAFLADFGLARSTSIRDDLESVAGAQLSGTIAYLAPEQIEGDPPTARTDQYALACVLFECLTGRRPFERPDEVATIYAHLSEPAPSASRLRSGLPAGVDAVLARGLAKRPEDRFESCGELMSALAEAIGLSPQAASTRRRRWPVLVAVGVAAIAGTAAVVLHGGGSSTPQAAKAKPPADPVVLIDPATAQAVRQVNGGQSPAAVAADRGHVWVLSDIGQTVTEVDPGTGDAVQTFAGPEGAEALAVSGNTLWVTSSGDKPKATPFDLTAQPPAAGSAVPLPGQGTGTGLITSPAGVWAVGADGSVTRVQPAPAATVPQSQAGAGLAYAGGALWALAWDGVLQRIDPNSLRVTASVPAPVPGGSPSAGLAVGGGSVWLASPSDGALLAVDAAHPGPPRRIATGVIGIGSLAYANGRIWAIDADANVLEIDPATGKTAAKIPPQGTPRGIVPSASGLWVPTIRANCRPMEGPYANPQLIVASDFPLRGQDGADGRSMAAAVRFELEQHKFRAGHYTLGYRSCDDGRPDGQVDGNRCTANARGLAARPAVVGVVGTYNSDCTFSQLPIFAAAKGGPVQEISPANTWAGLSYTGVTNFARVVPTNETEAGADIRLAAELGVHKLAILGGGTDWDFFRDVTEVAAARQGIHIVDAGGWPDARSEADALVRRVGSEADGVVIAGYLPADPATFKLLRQRMGRAPVIVYEVYGRGVNGIPGIVSYAGDSAVGAYVSEQTPPASALSDAGNQWVRTFAVQQRGQVRPWDPLAAQAADVLLGAIARSDGTRRSIVAKARESVDNGLLKPFGFTIEGDVTPAPVTILQIKGAGSAAGTDLPAYDGGVYVKTITVPPFIDGLADGKGTKVALHDTIDDPSATPCEAPSSPCLSSGTFTAGALCANGTVRVRSWWADGAFAPEGDRTYTCSDGSALTLHYRNFDWVTLSAAKGRQFVPWTIKAATGRFAGMTGEGVGLENYRFTPDSTIFEGTLTGYVRQGPARSPASSSPP
jgi:ABC-type branched-subunit amino acid transport system substrate-binding protein